MKQVVEIVIRADVPENAPDLGHEGIVAAKSAAEGIALMLRDLGLHDARATRRLASKKAPNDTATLPRAIPFKPAA